MAEILYGLTGVIAVSLPVIIVLLILLFSYRKEQERNRLIQGMIEKGENPENIIPMISKPKQQEEQNPTKHFKSGVTLLSVGLGFVAVWALSDWDLLGVGGFIAMIGLGEIVVAWYLRKYSK